MSKERNIPCVSYVCHGSDCLKGRKNVEHSGCCQTCKKYQPRKTGKRKEKNMRIKRHIAAERAAKQEMREAVKG